MGRLYVDIYTSNIYFSDLRVEKLVNSWTSQLRAQLNKIIGHTRVMLTKADMTIGQFQSNMANLVTDAIFEKVRQSKIKMRHTKT